MTGMKRFSWLVAVMLLSAFAFSLTGCGGSRESSSEYNYDRFEDGPAPR
ncbi:MAG: hypothetical protein OHK0029_26180 [Armatimonadaceae bacterium]